MNALIFQAAEASSPRPGSGKQQSYQFDFYEEDTRKKLRGTLRRYQRKLPQEGREETLATVERMMERYLFINHGKEVDFNFCYVAGPLATVFSRQDSCLIFEAFLKQFELTHQDMVESRCVQFLVLLRTLLPDLYNHLESEEVDLKAFSLSWMKYLLSQSLDQQSLLRLWDSYVSMLTSTPSPLCKNTASSASTSSSSSCTSVCSDTELDHSCSVVRFHTCVCLAIMKAIKDELEDLEGNEISGILNHLPALNMEEILREALNIQFEICNM